MKRTKKAEVVNPKFELTYPIEKLKNCPWNPRKITPEQRAALVKSILRFGQVQPLVVNVQDKMVLGGNQRLDALREANLKFTPVVFVDLGERDARALNLALNRIAGEWDYPALEGILRSLGKDESISIGFSETEYRTLVEAMALAGPKLIDLAMAEEAALDGSAGALPDTWKLSTEEAVRCPKCGHEAPLRDFVKVDLEPPKGGKSAKSNKARAH